MIEDRERSALQRIATEAAVSFAKLSQVLGRNPAYIQQYITRGSPARLKEEDRRTLARYFNVAVEERGGEVPMPGVVQIPRLQVSASAGAGALVGSERAVAKVAFDMAWIAGACRARPDDLALITVSGDSMAPTLMDGDDVLVDHSDAAPRLRDGIYVLRRDDTLMIKRLGLAPTRRSVTISSDNPTYPTWPDCPPDSIAIIGRAVWSGRRLG